jgi:membrane protein EpsK
MNLAENIAYFQTNVVNGILLVFYLISIYGVAACGHIPLTTSITEYRAIIVQFLNRAISGYLAFYLKEDFTVANSYNSNISFITFYHVSLSCVMYHGNYLKITVLDKEKSTGPIVAVCNVIQTFSSGVA